jgi:hypothetical protein
MENVSVLSMVVGFILGLVVLCLIAPKKGHSSGLYYTVAAILMFTCLLVSLSMCDPMNASRSIVLRDGFAGGAFAFMSVLCVKLFQLWGPEPQKSQTVKSHR